MEYILLYTGGDILGAVFLGKLFCEHSGLSSGVERHGSTRVARDFYSGR